MKPISPKNRAVRDSHHRELVLGLPCWNCEREGRQQTTRTQGHHVHNLRGPYTRSDYRMIPLDQQCHAHFENHGRQVAELEIQAAIDTLNLLYGDRADHYIALAGLSEEDK
tara:strand:- start:53 stop:385 length:333 start_codon:yes stop_codon:yes gene_type:complete